LHGRFSFRSGDWKILYWPDGGGFGDAATANDWKNPLPKDRLQLFDLRSDPAEMQNVIRDELGIARQLTSEFKRLIEDGASREGAVGKNDVNVHWLEPLW
jgi:hypothetical protein